MKNALWEFIDDQGTFISKTAHRINTLYLPLCNNSPITSSISPDLHGDLKTNFHSFLLEPVSRIDLSNLKSSRNFWIYLSPKKIWSVTGVSKDIQTIKSDEFKLEAGLLWQKVMRQNRKIGLKAEITSFVPATGEPVEIMFIEITNISPKPINFIPTSSIPIYGRSKDFLHNHRHVTSLLNRIQLEKFGLILKPTLSFNETGHQKNSTSYFILGTDAALGGPEYIYPTQEEFCADASDLEWPQAVVENLLPPKKSRPQGKEAIGALRFQAKTLKPNKSFSYIILMGIVEEKRKIRSLLKKFNTPRKIARSLKNTRSYWQKKGSQILLKTEDSDFDNWLRWVNIQPTLRKIFGCSFLPDFDYGRGGRGWRDLWQDCLSLILTNPVQTRPLLLNNFKGVRIDGSNATIIGEKPGDFIADRNNISRIWMDHGIWPLFTTHLYIHQTGDLKILFEKVSYFPDRQACRKIYQGTILEHLLVQNLVQFFNVGPHNFMRLENADWNDGLDMAAKNGESVAFSAIYAKNLDSLCEILEKLKRKNVIIFKELTILLDSIFAKKINPSNRLRIDGERSRTINYADIAKKRKILNDYHRKVNCELSGKVISLPTKSLIADLRKKSEWLRRHIRKSEWLREGFFNGYYNNDKQRVEGKINKRIQMTLTGQVFPIMSAVATDEQIETIFKNTKKYLKSPEFAGWHLNTDFKKEQLNLGRAFSFVYGEKENGAFFNHMVVMFSYALYSRGFAKEGFEVINSVYQMAKNTQKSKIYPCLPEYFNADGRGMYSYLTGSASWFIFTLLTQSFGVRGDYGNLLIEPKLTAAQFGTSNNLSITANFVQKQIEVIFLNPQKKDFGRYAIKKLSLNDKVLIQDGCLPYFSLSRKKILSLANRQSNRIEIILD